MTITEFELLMIMKIRSNAEFHKNGQTLKEAKEQLMSLSNELKGFETPLNNSLMLWINIGPLNINSSARSDDIFFNYGYRIIVRWYIIIFCTSGVALENEVVYFY